MGAPVSWLALGVLLSTAMTVRAEEGSVASPEPSTPDPPTAMTTPEVVISATRTLESSSQVPASVSVLTREEIERTPFANGHQVDDLLRYVPGVQPSTLSSRYNHPTAQAISLRGLGSRRTLVLLDGVPLNDGFGGWINWGLVPNDLARVEVVPGGGSNLYGTWAMGGVVHLITREPYEAQRIRVDSQVGNLDSYHQALSVRSGTERLNLTLGYRWFHTNGFIPVPADQRGPIDQPNDSRHQHVSGSISAQLTSHTSATLSGSLFREDRSFGTPLSLATRTIGHAALGMAWDPGDGDRLEASVFAQWQTFRNLTSRVTPTPTLRLNEFRDRSQTVPSNDFGGLTQWTTRISPMHRLLIGADARTIIARSEEDLFSPLGPTGRMSAKGQQLGWGIFGEWIFTPTGRLTIIPSLRSDWWKNFNARLEMPQGDTRVPRDNVEHALNPKFAVHYRFIEHLRAAASVYQAFRAPTLNELYRGFGFAGFTFLPNENLTPERLTGAEASLEGDLFDRRLRWRFTGHYDEVQDQILFVTQDAVTAQRQNVGRTRAVGGEAEVTVRPVDEVTIHIGYAYTDSVITSFSGGAAREGKRIPNVSRNQVTIGLTLGRPESWQVTLLARYLSRQFADDLNTQPVADFVVLDASVQKSIAPGVRLFLNGENITDRGYIATQTGPIKTLGAPLLVMAGIRMDY